MSAGAPNTPNSPKAEARPERDNRAGRAGARLGWPAGFGLAAMGLLGCRAPSAPVLPVVDVELPVAMQLAPGGREGWARWDGTVTGPTTATTVTLDGWWSELTAAVDGAPVAEGAILRPGVAPLTVSLPGLAAGPHVLGLRLTAPNGISRRLSLANRMFALRDGVVRLHARPAGASSLDSVAVPLVDGQARAIVTGRAAAGDTVEVVVSLDGTRVAAWGPEPATPSASAESDTPSAPASSTIYASGTARWAGERWAVNTPALYMATAILRDGGGRIVDAYSARVGMRDSRLTDGGLVLNGAASPLLAMRLDPAEDPRPTLQGIEDAAGNAVEVHGLVAGGPWLARFDEWGLPVVEMPRCDGNLEIGPADAATLAGMAAEDVRLVRFAAGHPAVLAWACEGAPQLRDRYCGDLHGDPLARPVLGLDGFGVSMAGDQAGSGNRTWVIEVGGSSGFVGFDRSAAAFLAVTGQGGPGGVMLPPPPMARDTWAAAWTRTAQALGAVAWKRQTHRAPSVVVVDGLVPGQVAIVEAPWLAPVGAAADATGRARIELWYQGPATLVLPSGRSAITLTADAWNGVDRVSHALTVAAR